jgi:hypothetical protein
VFSLLAVRDAEDMMPQEDIEQVFEERERCPQDRHERKDDPYEDDPTSHVSFDPFPVNVNGIDSLLSPPPPAEDLPPAKGKEELSDDDSSEDASFVGKSVTARGGNGQFRCDCDFCLKLLRTVGLGKVG